MEGRFFLRAGGAIAGAVVVGAAFFFCLSAVRPPLVVLIGEPIRQDDFLYTVVGVSKAHALGNDDHRVVARGLFYVATIEVANQALRVSYRWDPSIVYVTDAAGRKYQVSLDGQRALDAAKPTDLIVEPGSATRFQVAFDLPSGVARPELAFSNGILMGDVFNGAAYMRARVPLD
jgi:uncharacterized protein DUF4352